MAERPGERPLDEDEIERQREESNDLGYRDVDEERAYSERGNQEPDPERDES